MSSSGLVLVAAMLAVGAAAGTSILRSGGAGPASAPDGSPIAPNPTAGAAPAALGRPFALAEGQTAVLEGGLSLTFVSVAEDSRCPADVVCVWEGNARIDIDAEVEGAAQASLGLDTNPGFETEATYGSFTIHLLALEPYPRTDTVSAEPYRATLVVRSIEREPVPSPSSSTP